MWMWTCEQQAGSLSAPPGWMPARILRSLVLGPADPAE